jgi:hypothetical protein
MEKPEPTYEIKFQKARKDHRCTACGTKIPKGMKYWVKNEVYPDGQFKEVVEKQHSNCISKT